MTEALDGTGRVPGNGSGAVEGVTETPGADAAAAVPAGVAGHDSAMTVWSPVRWWGVPMLRFAFFVVRHTGLTLPLLRKLSFIDYARWAIVKHFPTVGPPQGRDPRRRHHMMFESNFNGTWDQYIDAFAEVMPKRFSFFWGSSINFPGPLPTGPFRAWIDRHHFEVQYYEAAEDATATVITSALRLERKLRRFARRSKRWDAEKFHERYQGLLSRVEADL
jgi:hypothetical protein